MENYIIYTHSDPEKTSLTDFLGPNNITNLDKISFLSFTAQGISNLDRIYNNYTAWEKLANKISYDSGTLDLLKINTELAIPKDEHLNLEILAITGKNQLSLQHDSTSFFAQRILNLYNDSSYVIEVDNTKDIRIFATVWLYSQVLNKLINITSFLSSLSTNVNKSGGNFSIELMPVVDIEKPTLNNLYKSNSKERKRNNFYFHKNISSNDLVVIRFEKLKNEKSRKDFINDYNIPYKRLAEGNIYDMIGLVDKNYINESTDDISIRIEGRDLIKLLIEDNSYFIPVQFATNIMANVQDDNKLLHRIGQRYELFAFRSFQQIKQSIQFIINQLSNIGIVSDEVFGGYGDRRTTVYRKKDGSIGNTSNNDGSKNDSITKLKNEANLKSKANLIKEEIAPGVWSIIKILIDKNISDRRIVDSSISQPDGSLLNQIHKLCQEPFVEFFTDTYEDQFYFIIRQPPFTQSLILDAISQGMIIDIEDKDVMSTNLGFDEDGIYSWYEMHAQGAFLGKADSTSLAYIPAVYFPQYANIWGSKRLSITSNYLPYSGFMGSKKEEDRRYLVDQVINDYKIVLDINVCNPFLRKGQITLAKGDRRIKRGTFIRLKSTDEVYYVDAVGNSLNISERSVERTTTMTLIRGMKEKFINGVHIPKISSKKISYFNIVDTQYIADAIKQKQRTGGQMHVRKDYGVNQEVFDFFKSRKQFE